MTKSEMFKILDSVIIENDFWLSEMDECRGKNFDLMENITSIFKMEKARDFTLLMASIKLLCKDPVPVINYFREENNHEIQFEEPVRNDLLIIATVFQTNPVFFSLCWNFVAMIENELASTSLQSQNKNIILFPSKSALLHNQCVEFDMFVPANAASESGFNNITRIPVDLLGELEIQGNRETKRIFFTIFLNPENENLKFELEIEFEVDGVLYKTSLRKDYDDPDREISGKPIHVDFTKGFVLKKFTWKRI